MAMTPPAQLSLNPSRCMSMRAFPFTRAAGWPRGFFWDREHLQYAGGLAACTRPLADCIRSLTVAILPPCNSQTEKSLPLRLTTRRRHRIFTVYVLIMMLAFLVPVPTIPLAESKHLDKLVHFGVFLGFALVFYLRPAIKGGVGGPDRPRPCVGSS